MRANCQPEVSGGRSCGSNRHTKELHLHRMYAGPFEYYWGNRIPSYENAMIKLRSWPGLDKSCYPVILGIDGPDFLPKPPFNCFPLVLK